MRRRVLRKIPVTLVDVYNEPNAEDFLYRLLAERKRNANISHKKMPTLQQHVEFVRNRPYRAWYLIEAKDSYVGSIYLTRENEIGISIFEEFQGNGYGGTAIEALITNHPRERYLANISPKNKHSAKFFKQFGFKLIQHTYELR